MEYAKTININNMALSTAEELTRKLEATCRGSLLQTQDILFHG